MLVLDLSSDVCASDETTQTIASHQTDSDSSSENDSETTKIVASHQTASDSSKSDESDSSNLMRMTRESC